MIEDRLMKALSKLLSEIPFKVKAAVLFGSRARGEELPWSDVDLLLISDDFREMKREDRIRPILDKWSYDRPLEPVCLAPDEISEEEPLIWEVCTHGIPIFDDGTFQRIKEKCINYMRKRGVERRWYGYIQI
jgi:predicted nucleotidyltransferase